MVNPSIQEWLVFVLKDCQTLLIKSSEDSPVKKLFDAQVIKSINIQIISKCQSISEWKILLVIVFIDSKSHDVTTRKSTNKN